MELNRENIIKALECCTKDGCTSCPYFKTVPCQKPLMQNALALIKELTEENARLRADKKELVNENAELKNQIQEADFTEEEIDFIDEYTRLLNEGIRDAKANNVSEIKTYFAMCFGTYTDKDMTPITEVFYLLDKFAKEMFEEG